MHPLIEKKLEKNKLKGMAERYAHEKDCPECTFDQGWQNYTCHDNHQICANTTSRANFIIWNSGDLLSDNEKLNHLFGDGYFNCRKEIIEKMMSKGIHPNDIKYQTDLNPLYEALDRKDKQFARFLLQHGATLDEKAKKMISAEFLADIIK